MGATPACCVRGGCGMHGWASRPADANKREVPSFSQSLAFNPYDLRNNQQARKRHHTCTVAPYLFERSTGIEHANGLLRVDRTHVQHRRLRGNVECRLAQEHVVSASVGPQPESVGGEFGAVKRAQPLLIR